MSAEPGGPRDSASDPSALERHLARTLELARRSSEEGSFPVGAVVVAADGRTIGLGYNRTQGRGSPVHHAEMEALGRARRHLAAAAPSSVLLVSSGEPCLMCVGAILLSPAIGHVAWAFGPLGPTGSALAAVRASGYSRERLEGLQIAAEPSPTARSESCTLLYRWCREHGDPRAAYFAGICGSSGAVPGGRRTPSHG